MGCCLFKKGLQGKDAKCPAPSMCCPCIDFYEKSWIKVGKTRKLERNQLLSEKQRKVNAIQWDVV
jgi:hypothetical protein